MASRARKEIENHETPEIPDLPEIIKPINRPILKETQLWNKKDFNSQVQLARKEIEDSETPDLPEIIKPINRPTVEKTLWVDPNPTQLF